MLKRAPVPVAYSSGICRFVAGDIQSRTEFRGWALFGSTFSSFVLLVPLSLYIERVVPSCYITLRCIIEQKQIYILNVYQNIFGCGPTAGRCRLLCDFSIRKAVWGVGIYLMYLLHSGDGSVFLDDSDAGDDGDDSDDCDGRSVTPLKCGAAATSPHGI